MKNRFIISGGGTGGHIFPALAIAHKIKQEIPDAAILFIGANHKMEMKIIPAAGYEIKGLNIVGINRSFSLNGILNNLKLPFILLQSFYKAKKIIRKFKPDVVIGVGGFASAAALTASISLKIPTLIQEQNSFPGITNRLLSKKVKKICVAYDHLEKYFPADKIIKTGNPIRHEIINLERKNEEAYQFFNLQKETKTVLVVGGSLGARTINQCIAAHIEDIKKMNIQLIWQTGESFYKTISPELLAKENENIKIVPFIKKMAYAYSIADIIVSRAGAIAISELSIVGAPTILVPFPYATEDHQTKNANALVRKNAAYLVTDTDVPEKLFPLLKNLLNNQNEANILRENMTQFALPNAIDDIYKEIITL